MAENHATLESSNAPIVLMSHLPALFTRYDQSQDDPREVNLPAHESSITLLSDNR